MRANDATKIIPAAIVSVAANEFREEVLTSVIGVIDWLEKPIDEKRLIRAIRRGADLNANGRGSTLIVEDNSGPSEILRQG